MGGGGGGSGGALANKEVYPVPVESKILEILQAGPMAFGEIARSPALKGLARFTVGTTLGNLISKDQVHRRLGLYALKLTD